MVPALRDFLSTMSPRGGNTSETADYSNREIDAVETTKASNKRKIKFQVDLSSIEKAFADFGRDLEEIIDNSPIGVKLPCDQQQQQQKSSSAKKKKKAISAAPSQAELYRRNWNPATTVEKEDRGDRNPFHFFGAASSQIVAAACLFLESPSATACRSLEEPFASTKEVAAAAKKGAVAVGGGALITIGVVMIPTLPPPFATLTMLGGYAVLGTEFEGPRNVVRGARDKLIKSLDDTEEEREAADEAADEEWEDVGDDGSAKKEKKGKAIKKAAKSFGKTVVLPALEKVCSAYEIFEDEKAPQDKNDTSDAAADEEKIAPAADEVVVDIEEPQAEDTPAADEVDEVVVEIEEPQSEDTLAADEVDELVLESEEPQTEAAEDSFFDANEETPAIVEAKSDDWTDVEDETEGKVESLADSGNEDDDDWDDAVVVSHLDD